MAQLAPQFKPTKIGGGAEFQKRPMLYVSLNVEIDASMDRKWLSQSHLPF
ncbi:MAG: hypothetical protein JRH15_00825 [Deltaproteobacteria bacterium]|nr:hypothetical protein [Deltaproteobacteria bacterium]